MLGPYRPVIGFRRRGGLVMQAAVVLLAIGVSAAYCAGPCEKLTPSGAATTLGYGAIRIARDFQHQVPSFRACVPIRSDSGPGETLETRAQQINRHGFVQGMGRATRRLRLAGRLRRHRQPAVHAPTGSTRADRAAGTVSGANVALVGGYPPVAPPLRL